MIQAYGLLHFVRKDGVCRGHKNASLRGTIVTRQSEESLVGDFIQSRSSFPCSCVGMHTESKAYTAPQTPHIVDRST